MACHTLSPCVPGGFGEDSVLKDSASAITGGSYAERNIMGCSTTAIHGMPRFSAANRAANARLLGTIKSASAVTAIMSS